MENRNGLIVDHELTSASSTGERTAAVDMVTPLPGTHRVTGADQGFDTANFIDDLPCLNATLHVAQNTKNGRSAIDARTTRHPGYTVSQPIRKRIEETFGWDKMVGPLRLVNVRSVAKNRSRVPADLRGLKPGADAQPRWGRAMTLGTRCDRGIRPKSAP